MMTQRIVYGTLAIVSLVTLFALDVSIAKICEDWNGPVGELLRRGSVLPLATAFVFLLGAIELVQLLRLRNASPFATYSYSMVVLIILAPWFAAAGWLGNGSAEIEGFLWLVVFLALALVGGCVAAVLRGQPQDSMRDLGASWLILIYVGFLGAFPVLLRCGRDIPGVTGAWLLLIVALLTKVSDIGAFFVGSLIGRHKLIPSVSPGKTIEGTVGGIVFSVLGAVLIVSLGIPSEAVGVTSDADDSQGFMQKLGIDLALSIFAGDAQNVQWFRAMFLGAALAIAGQIGDLVESCFKRDAGVKDSGHVIPRFGGILDLIDSLLVAVPIGWILLIVVWGVV